MRKSRFLGILLLAILSLPTVEAGEGVNPGGTGDPLTGVGELFTPAGAEEARKRLRTALETYRRQGDRQGEAVCWFLLGAVASDLTEARADLERSAAMLQAAGDRFGAWMALETLAEAEASQAEIDAAIAHHQRVLTLLEEAEVSNDPFSPTSLPLINQAMGMTQENQELMLSAPGLFKPILLRYAEGMSRMAYGGTLVDAGRLEEAEGALSRAAEISRLFDGAFDTALAVRWGDLRRRQWRFDEAREHYRKVLRAGIFQSAGAFRDERLDELQILEKLEVVAMLSGRIDEALTWNDQIILLARRRGDPILETSALHERGKCLKDGQRPAAAEAALTEALAMAQKNGHALLQGLILLDLAELEMWGGRYQKAVTHLETSARLFRAEAVPVAEAKAWNLLAGAYLYLEDEAMVAATLENAQQVAKKSGDRRAQEAAELMAATLRFRLHPGDASEIEKLIGSLAESPEISWEDILACFRATASLTGKEPPQPLPIFSSGEDTGKSGPPGYHHFVLGLTHFQRGELAAARELWNKALEESPDRERAAPLLQMIGHTYWREGNIQEAISFLARAVDAAELNARDIGVEELLTAFLAGYSQSLYQDLIGLLIAQGRVEEAFDYTERARARAFLQLLGNHRREPARGADARLVEEAAVLRARIEEWQLALQSAPPREQARLSEDLRHAREQFASLLVRLKVSNAEYGTFPQIEPLKLKSVQAGLPSDTTLISYFVTPGTVHAWVVDRETLQYVPLTLNAEDLRQAVCWADGVGRQGGRGLRLLGSGCGESASSEKVYDQLFAPLAEKIRNPRLLLVPHGVLHYIPFAALRNPATGRYLLEDYTLLYAPSASALSFLRGKETPVEGRALVLGDPTTSASDLTPLPAAQREATAVARALGTSPLLGPEAAESRLFGLAGQVDLLHIAAHGIFDPASPLFSRIALAPGQGRDGNLEVHEILSELDLTGVNLVVLAACSTAAGKRSEGDEIAGLTRAFLYAGSPGVISSLWDIDDEASALLMEELYRRLLAGASAAEALRQAQLTLLREPRHSDPYYWAAFSLAGDPQGRWPAHPVQETKP